jgi:SsrA-binding protein
MKTVNPSARHYQVFDKVEAGIVLTGGEVKSVKKQGVVLKEAFVQMREGEAYLVNAHIANYQFVKDRVYDPKRARKLLLGKKQLTVLVSKKKQGLAIIPLVCYNKHGWIKVQIGTAKKKTKYEKKKSKIEKEIKREIRRF